MTVPLRLNCDCGRSLQAEAGAVVTCECGRRYDASRIPSAEYLQVQAAQVRMRTWSRIGLLVIGLGAVLAWAFVGMIAAFIVLPTAGLVWFRLVLPQLRRKQQAELAALPTWRLEVNKE